MADAVTSQKLIDTVHRTAYKFTNISDGSGESDIKKVDLSELNFAIKTVTLSAAPATNFCVGEILTFDADGSAVYATVQDYRTGASTVNIIGATSGTDQTITATAAPGAANTISGSISGASTITTHGSTAIAGVAYNVTLEKLEWYTTNGAGATGGMDIKIEWDGSGSEALIAVITGSGKIDFARHYAPVAINAAGDASDVLGDVQFTTVGHASPETYLILMDFKKRSGFDRPVFGRNVELGYESMQGGMSII